MYEVFYRKDLLLKWMYYVHAIYICNIYITILLECNSIGLDKKVYKWFWPEMFRSVSVIPKTDKVPPLELQNIQSEKKCTLLYFNLIQRPQDF